MQDAHTPTETKNPNGTTTYRIPAIRDWFTTNKAELEAMVAQYKEVGHYEQEK